MKQLIVISLLFTSAVTYLPQYVVIAQLHLVNTYWALILPAVGGSLGLYLMMNFMSTLPTEMIEAARIDGASEFRIYAQVIMPNVKPAWLTLIIFSFQGLWRAESGVMIYEEALKPLTSIIASITAGGIVRAQQPTQKPEPSP